MDYKKAKRLREGDWVVVAVSQYPVLVGTIEDTGTEVYVTDPVSGNRYSNQEIDRRNIEVVMADMRAAMAASGNEQVLARLLREKEGIIAETLAEGIESGAPVYYHERPKNECPSPGCPCPRCHAKFEWP